MQSTKRARRAAAQNNVYAPVPVAAAPVPAAAAAPAPPPRDSAESSLMEEEMDGALGAAAAAPAAAPVAAANTPRRNNTNRQISFSGTATTTPVPTSVRVGRSQSPALSATSSISFGTSAAAAAHDINNDEELSVHSRASVVTVGTVIRQDNAADILIMAAADAADMGDGGDSDCEHEGGNLFVCERDRDDMFEVAEEQVQDDDGPDDSAIPGAPEGWKPKGPPDNWASSAPKDRCPPWTEVNTPDDNPGGWSSYSYQARYNKQGKYKGHFTPTGATVAPKDDISGQRTVGDGWTVNYDGSWVTSSDTPHRHGAGKDNIMPEERKGRLDAELLKKMGLTMERMNEKDAMFFHQLLFPICHPKESGIADDPRKSFYTSVAQYTNTYAVNEKGKGVPDYSHGYKLVCRKSGKSQPLFSGRSTSIRCKAFCSICSV